MLPVPVPSVQLTSKRCMSKTEAVPPPPPGTVTTFTVSVTDWIIAFDGIWLVKLNCISSRLRKPLELAPETKLTLAPRLLFGSFSNRLVSAQGAGVTESPQTDRES